MNTDNFETHKDLRVASSHHRTRLFRRLFLACVVVAIVAPLNAAIPVDTPAGQLVGFGLNDQGQTNVPAGNDFVAVSGGSLHSLALRADGSLAGWGGNEYGQANVPAGNDFVAIAAGSLHSLALRADGSLVGWGWNDLQQADVPAGNDFVAIAADSHHSLALRADGSLVGWGWNMYGETDVPAGNDFVAVATGCCHSVALRADGSLVVWGDNRYGQLNDVPAGNNFVAIAAGAVHTLALRADGSLVGWGSNFGGSTNVPPGNDFVAIAAGGHSLALRADGSLAGWGNNFYGQANVPAGNDFVAIAAGDDHSLAIKRAWTPVDIDIQPGTDPNTINNDGHGVIPVAILGSAEFDVLLVLPETVVLEGMPVKSTGKDGKFLAHVEDVNSDGFADLVVQIADVAGAIPDGATVAVLTGKLLDGTLIRGSDEIDLVP